jgi:hypothetical protein
LFVVVALLSSISVVVAVRGSLSGVLAFTARKSPVWPPIGPTDVVGTFDFATRKTLLVAGVANGSAVISGGAALPRALDPSLYIFRVMATDWRNRSQTYYQFNAKAGVLMRAERFNFTVDPEIEAKVNVTDLWVDHKRSLWIFKVIDFNTIHHYIYDFKTPAKEPSWLYPWHSWTYGNAVIYGLSQTYSNSDVTYQVNQLNVTSAKRISYGNNSKPITRTGFSFRGMVARNDVVVCGLSEDPRGFLFYSILNPYNVPVLGNISIPYIRADDVVTLHYDQGSSLTFVVFNYQGSFQLGVYDLNGAKEIYFNDNFPLAATDLAYFAP